MADWKALISPDLLNDDIDTIREHFRINSDCMGIYPDSIQRKDGCIFFMARENDAKVLIVYGQTAIMDMFCGTEFPIGTQITKTCPLTNENCDVLKSLFPFISPISHRGRSITIGLGDRLGLASAAHLRLIKDKDLFPVLAQQSIRELNLTGRTYRDVLSAASWAVFQEGYTTGFGADGDHLKTTQEVQMALDCGFTMITLDCSEHIDNKAAELSEPEINTLYANLSEAIRAKLEQKYLNKPILLKDGTTIIFHERTFKKIVLVYLKAISYTLDIYHNTIKPYGRAVEIEMSIDETLTPTSPESHFFVASELTDGGIEITSLAPRFCGEFQKGIDYMGDKAQFENEFRLHVKIAEHFSYKISVHSGSDKFSVFPIIGRLTKGMYHLKTAGTNWLEAVRTIARKAPELYRRLHAFAVAHLDEAKKYYHISADLSKVPDIRLLKDSELDCLMDQNDSRQVLHITYGLILQAKNAQDAYHFRDELYKVLFQFEKDYDQALITHIGRHLTELGI